MQTKGTLFFVLFFKKKLIDSRLVSHNTFPLDNLTVTVRLPFILFYFFFKKERKWKAHVQFPNAQLLNHILASMFFGQNRPHYTLHTARSIKYIYPYEPEAFTWHIHHPIVCVYLFTSSIWKVGGGGVCLGRKPLFGTHTYTHKTHASPPL
jgi:hypothetical protein